MTTKYKILHAFGGRNAQRWKNNFSEEDYPLIDKMIEEGLLYIVDVTGKKNIHGFPMIAMTDIGWEICTSNNNDKEKA